jgi:hypothetical protein
VDAVTAIQTCPCPRKIAEGNVSKSTGCQIVIISGEDYGLAVHELKKKKISSSLFNLLFYSLLPTPTQCVGWVNVAAAPGSKVQGATKLIF